MKTKNINLSKLFPNEGQIPGLKKNPRALDETKFEQLKKSIQDDPEMLELRELIVYPLEEGVHYVVIGGNMRLRAAEDLGLTSLPCKILPNDFPIKKMEAILVKDNVSYGRWDWDEIFNGWDTEELKQWGMEIHFPRDTTPTDHNQVEITTIKLEYTLEDYVKVRDYLAKISDNPEQAVWKLCGFE